MTGEYWLTKDLITKLPTSMPILFLSGRKDELVPPSHMDTLFQLCSSKEKQFKAIPDGMHNDTCARPHYFEEIASFLRRYVVPKSQQSVPQSPEQFGTSEQASSVKHSELRKRGAAPASDEQDGEVLTDEGDWVKMSNSDISRDGKL